MNSSKDRPTLSPSGIGQYIAFSECPRYFKLRFDDEGEENERAWNEAFKPLSVLLSGTGDSFEDQTRESIEEKAAEGVDAEKSWSFDYDFDTEFSEAFEASRKGFEQSVEEAQDVANGDDPILLYEAPLCGYIQGWPIGGRADVVALWPAGEGELKIHILEIKASWKRKSYHQIQASIYAILLEDILDQLGVDYGISAGVIHRETEEEDFVPEELPTFDLETRKQDVKRLLAKDGKLDSIVQKDVDEVKYQLNAKCNNCIFNESCFTRAIEGLSTALLGLSIGEQRALEKHNVDSIEQLARLKYPPEDAPRPWKYENLEPNEDEEGSIGELVNEPAIGGKLDQIIQRAQSMLGEIQPDHDFARDEPFATFYMGAGNGTLPDDDPHDALDVEYETGEMIRVYLYVQWDYMRDRLVMLNARIDCTNFAGNALSFSEISDSLPNDPEESKEVEKDLLKNFFNKLFAGIQDLAHATRNSDEATIHLYMFSKLERDRLMDGIRRHSEFLGTDDSGNPHPIRDLLGLRAAIDQSMVSIVQDDIVDRMALKFPSTGLLPALDQFHNGDGVGWWDYDQWAVEKNNGNEINLRNIFYHNFFNNESPYKRGDDDRIEMMLQRGAYQSSEREGFYPLRARFGNQIPLEYFWAAQDELDTDWADEHQYQEKRAIRKYKWYDHDEEGGRKNRIRGEELKLLGEKLCHALNHIESAIPSWGKNALLGKEPIEVPDLDDFHLGDTSLARACSEYLDLEYYSNRQEMLRQYAKSPRQRVQTGRSAVLRIKDIEETNKGVLVEGHILYDELDFGSPDQVANGCRLKGSEGSSSGSWMVATEVEKDNNGMFTEANNEKPEDIEGSVPTKVQEINTQNRRIVLKFSNFYNEEEGHLQYQNREFETRHKAWTIQASGEGKYTEYLSEGDVYILDEQTDNMTARRVRNTLDDPESNNLAQILESLLEEESGSNKLKYCQRSRTIDFLSWLEQNEELDTPNDKQKEFIKRDGQQIACLQGPPGTGKTGGALAYAILARAYARISDDDHIRGIVTAPSNKAVYEIMKDVAEVKEKFDDSGNGLFDSLRLVRATGKATSDFDQLEGVDYLNYGEDDEGVDDLADALDRERGLGAFIGGDPEPPESALIFATPSGSYGLMNNIARAWGHQNATEIIDKVQSYFNFLAIDEASMMPLSQFILSGAFVSEKSHILVGGDHRQMPPVRKHDWEEEDRRTVEEIAPHLSTLDFFRFLKGELEVEHADPPRASELPMDRLELTYRCHKRIANMLRRWMYKRYDEIEYRSKEEEVLSSPVSEIDAVREILDPEHPLILVLHDEDTSQQANPTEVEVAKSIVEGVPEDEDWGIVTPHNAQRGLLKNELGDEADIDTVERYQGGERDLIIVSGTASDRESIRKKHDFILNPNRLNVAMSRMKKKLVVVASKSLFEVIPTDAEDYEDALLWRGLYHEVDADQSEPLWSGNLSDFTDLDEDVDDAYIEVYSGS
jgi:CRISPR/Cas system-associated exonuclease Cas4 (RecB family)